jgi:hypothetical protein
MFIGKHNPENVTNHKVIILEKINTETGNKRTIVRKQ